MSEVIASVSRPEPEDVLAGEAIGRIRALSASLNRSEARVARRILAEPTGIVFRSVSEVAAEAGTSISTVVRCCQTLGFRGFQDMKIALARASIAPLQRIQGDIRADDSPQDVLHKVFSASEDAIRESTATIEPGPFAAAVGAIRAARRVLFVGVGTSAPLAQDAAYRFLTIGLRAEAPADVHVQHVVARLLGSEDVCVAISHTGSTRETLAAVRAASTAGATVVSLTSFARSPLTTASHIAIVSGSRETSFRMEAMASRIAHLCVLDALFVAVALAQQDRATEVLDITASVLSEHRY